MKKLETKLFNAIVERVAGPDLIYLNEETIGKIRFHLAGVIVDPSKIDESLSELCRLLRRGTEVNGIMWPCGDDWEGSIYRTKQSLEGSISYLMTSAGCLKRIR